MITTALREVAAAVNASSALAADETTVEVTGVVRIDSRDVEPGDLFLAIMGGNVDGHDYLPQAASRGAVAAIVDHVVDVDSGIPQLVVEDTIAALTALARDHARRLSATTTIIGITGSSGKTTTKDLLSQVLAEAGPTIAPPGSFNNEIGLPLTVLRADESTRFLVLEMGARGIGHIAHLADIAAPQIGVVLNVGSAHAGEFGGKDVTAKAKGELLEALPADGRAIINGDDAVVNAMTSRTQAAALRFGEGPANDIRATDITIADDATATFTLTVDGDSAPVSLALPGRHMVSNALAAAAVGHAVGLNVADIARALTAAVPLSAWRMEVTRVPEGPVVVNDAYNANPESVGAALASVSLIKRHGDLWVVLGEMLELGDERRAAHEAIGEQAVAAGADVVVAVGDEAIVAAIRAGAERAAGGPDRASAARVIAVADAEAAKMAVDELGDGDVVLVKASRGIGLETVAASIIERFAVSGGVS